MSGTPIEKLMNVSLGLRKPFDSERQVDEGDLVLYNRATGEPLGMIVRGGDKDFLFDAMGNWFAPSQETLSHE